MHPFGILLSFISCFLLVQCSTNEIIYSPSNGHFYQFVVPDTPITYSAALAYANSRYHNSKQGYLATINSAAETTFLSYVYNTKLFPYNSEDNETVIPTPAPLPAIWTGGKRSGQLWVWTAVGRTSAHWYDITTKQCVGYCNWLVNPPTFTSSDQCLVAYLYNTGNVAVGKWKGVSCSSTQQAFLVEYDASTTCSSGYTFHSVQGWCVDINECTATPKICGAGYTCQNEIGTFVCNDIDECLNTSICANGYRCSNRNGSYVCLDINECLQENICAPGYTCRNFAGSYACDDYNECVDSPCSTGYLCVNRVGSFACNDIDECASPNTCPFGTRCTNTIGSYTCDVLHFFIRSGLNNLVIDHATTSVAGDPIRMGVRKTANYTHQLWTYTPDGYIQNVGSSLVLDIEGGLANPGANVIAWSKKTLYNAINQRWSYNLTSNVIKSLAGPVVLDIKSGSSANGSPLIVWTEKTVDNANQKFYLEQL